MSKLMSLCQFGVVLNILKVTIVDVNKTSNLDVIFDTTMVVNGDVLDGIVDV
jgi:hypothetical protein